MNAIETGSIVLLKFPFTGGVGYKRRLALVIKDFEDGDIFVCRITSKIYESGYDSYLNDWSKFGLKLPSVIRVHKMATLETDMIETTLGRIDDVTLDKIKEIYISIMSSSYRSA
jgi:mRNA interferase MazF